MPPLLQMQKSPGKEGGGLKKVSLCHILADQKIVSSWKKCILGHEQQVIAYCQTDSDHGPPKMPLKLAV